MKKQELLPNERSSCFFMLFTGDRHFYRIGGGTDPDLLRGAEPEDVSRVRHRHPDAAAHGFSNIAGDENMVA